MKKKEDSNVTLTLLLTIGLIVTWGICIDMGIQHLGDDGDTINTQVFGETICEARGLEYDHRDLISVKEVEKDCGHGSCKILKIYCRHKLPIEDGLIVLTLGGE